MSDPLVSIIIPLFNKEDFIEKTLDSVVKQSYKYLELVLIDDSSSDDSLMRATRFLRQHQTRFVRVIIETRPNTGQSGARNDGILKSSGELVAFLDADDIWHPAKISEQVHFLNLRKDLDLVLCNYFMISTSSKTPKAVKLVPIKRKIQSWFFTTGYGGLLESTGLVRRAALLKKGGFDTTFQMGGGLDLAFRFSIEDKVGCVNKYLCGYRVTAGGWHNDKDDLLKSYEKIFEKKFLYREYEAKCRINLQIHLGLWNARIEKSWGALWNFLLVFYRHPSYTVHYTIASLIRVTIAQIRGFFYRRKARFWIEQII